LGINGTRQRMILSSHKISFDKKAHETVSPNQ
jgi:hypothetical protein